MRSLRSCTANIARVRFTYTSRYNIETDGQRNEKKINYHRSNDDLLIEIDHGHERTKTHIQHRQSHRQSLCALLILFVRDPCASRCLCVSLRIKGVSIRWPGETNRATNDRRQHTNVHKRVTRDGSVRYDVYTSENCSSSSIGLVGADAVQWV